MNIKILGTGCKKCKLLEENVREAVKNKNIDAQIVKIDDIPSIMKYGVMNTPGLVINEEVVSVGKSLSVSDIEKLLVI